MIGGVGATERFLIDGALPSFLDTADRFGRMVDSTAKPVARPQRVETTTWALQSSRWPLCPLCGVSVVEHDCDPDAVLAAFLALPLTQSKDASRG